jgi:hypothetical protein
MPVNFTRDNFHSSWKRTLPLMKPRLDYGLQQSYQHLAESSALPLVRMENAICNTVIMVRAAHSTGGACRRRVTPFINDSNYGPNYRGTVLIF